MNAAEIYGGGRSLKETAQALRVCVTTARKMIVASGGKIRNRSNRRGLSDKERFLEKVTVRGAAECWPWNGTRSALGYGNFFLSGHKRTAQRASYVLFVGAIPRRHEVDHICKNPRCVNPGHLRAVTKAENLSTRVSFNGTLTACRKGHPLSGDNLRLEKGGKARRCRQCERERRPNAKGNKEAK